MCEGVGSGDGAVHVVVVVGEALLGCERDDDRVVAIACVAVEDRLHGEDRAVGGEGGAHLQVVSLRDRCADHGDFRVTRPVDRVPGHDPESRSPDVDGIRGLVCADEANRRAGVAWLQRFAAADGLVGFALVFHPAGERLVEACHIRHVRCLAQLGHREVPVGDASGGVAGRSDVDGVADRSERRVDLVLNGRST